MAVKFFWTGGKKRCFIIYLPQFCMRIWELVVSGSAIILVFAFVVGITDSVICVSTDTWKERTSWNPHELYHPASFCTLQSSQVPQPGCCPGLSPGSPTASYRGSDHWSGGWQPQAKASQSMPASLATYHSIGIVCLMMPCHWLSRCNDAVLSQPSTMGDAWLKRMSLLRQKEKSFCRYLYWPENFHLNRNNHFQPENSFWVGLMGQQHYFYFFLVQCR